MVMKGIGRVILGSGFPVVTTVTGDVINEGPGCINVFTTNGSAVNIDGDVESEGGGGGNVIVFATISSPEGFPGSSGCEPSRFRNPLRGDGGPITIDGDTCGVEVDPDGTGGVTVKGDIEASCGR